MKKRNSFKTLFVLTTISLLGLLNAIGLYADPSDNLKPLLIDLKGWKAEKAEGASVNMGGMKMINAIRNYSKGNRTLDVTIIVGSNAMIQGQTQAINVETSDFKVNTRKIGGFDITQVFDKNKNSGYLIINLAKRQTEGSLFIFNYTGISPKEALEIAKKYDWKKIKTITSSMIN